MTATSAYDHALELIPGGAAVSATGTGVLHDARELLEAAHGPVTDLEVVERF